MDDGLHTQRSFIENWQYEGPLVPFPPAPVHIALCWHSPRLRHGEHEIDLLHLRFGNSCSCLVIATEMPARRPRLQCGQFLRAQATMITQFYLAYRRIKNFACVEVRPTLNQLKMFLKLDPDTVDLEEGFSRDVRKIGHFGTGDLELTIGSHDDLERAKPLILRSYEEG